MEAAQRFLNVSEAAGFLGVSAASLRKWSDEVVPVYRTPGGQRRYAPGDLEEFLDLDAPAAPGLGRRAALRAQRRLDHGLTEPPPATPNRPR